jgi:antitoxin component YwqK of YwqJK toxin-antitoxin module
MEIPTLTNANTQQTPTVTYYESGEVESETFYTIPPMSRNPIVHRVGGPARTEWYKNGQKRTESWNEKIKEGFRSNANNKEMRLSVLDDKKQRTPVYTEWYENGQKSKEVYYPDRLIGPNSIEWDEKGRVTSERYKGSEKGVFFMAETRRNTYKADVIKMITELSREELVRFTRNISEHFC